MARWSSSGRASDDELPLSLLSQYKLHEITTELARKEKEDERDPSYPDHGGLELRRGHAHGGGGGSEQRALTSTR